MSKKIIAISTSAMAIILFLGVMLFVNTEATCAQTSAGCAPLLTNGNKGWAKGAPVYYDVSGLPGGPTGKAQTNAIKAINAWNTANASNGSGVTFRVSDAQNPATLTVTVGPAGGSVAQITPTGMSNGTLTSAAIELNLNDRTLFDENITGYSDAILSAMLHELGHSMGLGDMPIDPTKPCGGQSANQSVMNGYCGTNDRGGNMPTGVKDCDNRSVTGNPQYQQSTGGGCGVASTSSYYTLSCGEEECPCGDCVYGCGGGEECPCGDCVYGCGDGCGWVDVEGQCYGGVSYGDCWDDYGVHDSSRSGCQYDPPYCDPPQEVYVCP